MYSLSNNWKKRVNSFVCYRPHAGEHIDCVLSEMVNRSKLSGTRITCLFNGIQIIVSPEMTKKEALRQWKYALKQSCTPFRKALWKQECAKYHAECKAKKQRVYQLLSTEKMEVPWYKLIPYLRTCWAQRKDNLSKEIIKFIQGWAVAMQQEIRKGSKPADIQDKLEQELDYIGLSGFTNLLAVAFLKKFWKYGNQLT
ncbi:hypothetical protein GYA37_00265 [candidate division WWE3 bacterium]|uniref:Uncharacterized protein n=1 Tax=candidate division WWE3 bacterium TaxID=2053526 RepID=A0A7X9HSF3_UNCKA|nr:hypothetical protein [candidate division WWE3 bacterium]